MSIPKKFINMTHSVQKILKEQALKSNCIQKLGAVITKGRNKIICRGHNDNMRTSFLNIISPCQHAEMNVATQFLNSFIKPNQLKVS
uniref:Uncharacterized protein n=1 Tax=viral metagenome TaxID=1070528 RepID=A0A6C0IZZ8_9ZZZZ